MSKTKAIQNKIVHNADTQRMVFRVLMSCILTLSVVYVYFIGSITFNVLARKSLELTQRNISSHISDLELAYLNSANKIDKDYALSLGFVNSNHNLFATRASNNSVAIR